MAWLCRSATDFGQRTSHSQAVKGVSSSLKISGLDRVGEEHSPPYDSQANGAVESAVKQIKGRLRTMKLCLERRIGKRVPPKHPIVAWLVDHCAALLRFRMRGSDGKTPYERIRLRPYNGRLMCFAEKIRYKHRAKEPIEDDHRFHQGIFLGIDQLTGQYVVFDPDLSAVRMSRTVKLLPDEVKWNANNIESVKVTPYDEFVAQDPGVIFQDRPANPDEQDPPRKQHARKLYLKAEDFRAYGHTVSCPRCDHERRYGPGRTTKGHSDACRQRIVAELQKTPEGRRRVDAAEERQHRSVAEELEQVHGPRGDQANPVHEGGNGDIAGDAPEDLGFEDLGEAELRRDPTPVATEVPPEHDIDDTIEADDAPQQPQAANHEPGMEIDMMHNENDNDFDLNRLLNALDQDQAKQMKEMNDEILSLVRDLGGNGNKYRRERGKAFRAIVSEIYSPPRVSAMAKLCPSYGILPGFALDLTTHDDDGRHWDFSEEEMRQRAWNKLKSEDPTLLIGSPTCTAFSQWQHINNQVRDPAIVADEVARGRAHLEFVCELYEYQARRGRDFLHEHPAQATSWQEPCIKKILELEGVQKAVGHQCQYGAEAHGQPIKKPSGFMSNSECIRQALSKLCTGKNGLCSREQGGQHIQCRGLVARKAAVYPAKLCKAILRGLKDQLRRDGYTCNGVVGMQEVGSVTEENCVDKFGVIKNYAMRAEATVEEVEINGYVFRFDSGEGPFFDDLTGQELPTLLVKEARRKELAYFEEKHVWRRVPIGQAVSISGRSPISVRWVDVNKGDDVTPDIRSRLVARQIRGANEDPLFAPTPPLEALRTILSYAATDMEGQKPKCRKPDSPNRLQISLIDISRAYFNAKCDPANPTFVSLPTEDAEHKSSCGLLLKHMYGTQAAADGWQREYSSAMVSLGFRQGIACPCVFWHQDRSLVCSVHGDDFTTAGSKPDLDWFEAELESRYELRKGGRIGPGKNDAKEGRVLNRVIRWTDQGLEYEADPRQAERLVEAMGLDDGCRSCVTPGLKPTAEQLQGEKDLDENEHTPYRGNGARCNYLGPDRPDIQFCAKEVCRWMAKPANLGQDALKRIARFLLGRRRLIFKYGWQRASTLECYSDTDWAGCQKTRKSTSGGCLLLGGHMIKSWSSTQPSISLSSGEAEYYGVVKASGIALGQQSLMRDLGMDVKVRVWTDSSAAMGICGRSGLGKPRHVQTHTLWVQERVKSGAIELRKVNGLVNPADLFTKCLSSRERIDQLVELFNSEYRDGRASTAPALRKTKTAPEAQAMTVGTVKARTTTTTTTTTTSAHDDTNNESPAHDPDILPHMYEQHDMDKLFMKAEAPEEGDSAPQSRCMCSHPDCEECFPAPGGDLGGGPGVSEAWLMQRGSALLPRRLRAAPGGSGPAAPGLRAAPSPRRPCG